MICFDDSFRIVDQDFEKVVFVGDLIDCYTLSDFLKDPRRIATLQEELDEANRVLSELYRLCPEIEFFEGNHEVVEGAEEKSRAIWSSLSRDEKSPLSSQKEYPLS